MKTVLVVVATTACLWSLAGRAADKLANSEVPDAVRAAVSKAYPDAASCVFERERRGAAVQYEAEFEIKEGDKTRRLSVEVSSQGVILAEEEQLRFEELPAPVREAHRSSRFSKATVMRVERLTRDGKTSYEVQVGTARGLREVVYDERGAVLDAGDGPSR